ncbi:baculoviral IAP repeat-containing protein 6 isoform X2 [Bacillus rossius redtenbacheri]|uniref:baculoviral IAP repeat-containing protein 6 isoform X2 n=1 Tax=Bacillus rossius redtenbacheri TaxID=93214 RepID=UPI002FDEF43C
MADDEVWKLNEDGLINVEPNCKSVIYHPNSNVIIAVKKSSEVIVVDVNSGVTLRRSSLSAKANSEIHGAYIPEYDKILFTDGGRIGIRRDYSGVLLLDTILQTPVSRPEDVVRVELPLSEAVLLFNTMRSNELSGVEPKTEVMSELDKKIKEGMAVPKKGTKAQKWSTVCLELSHAALKAVCTGVVQELKRQNKHVPALSIASAINEHLTSLLPILSIDEATKDRAFMFSEAARRETFGRWPHMNYKWALPDEMAQAGFYHQPNSTGDDRAMCFTCSVCLVCWEPTDEPWSEHERHSPACPFVRGEYTQNVPLSVTLATLPAAPLLDEGDRLSCVSTSSVPELVATATRGGQIVLWNVARQLKREVTFYVSAPSALPDGLQLSDILEPQEDWAKKKPGDTGGEMSIQEIEEITLDIAIGNILGPPDNGVELTAVAVVGRQKVQVRRQPSKKIRKTGRQSNRPLIVAGITVNPANRNVHTDSVWGSPMVRAMNDVNEASNRESQLLDIMKVRDADTWPKASDSPTMVKQTSLYLMVYAVHYYSPAREGCDDVTDDGGGGGGCEGGGKVSGKSKKISSGTGTTASSSDGRQEKNNILQDIFLSKFLYDVPMIEDIGSDTTLPAPHESAGDFVDSPSTKKKDLLYQLSMLGAGIGGAGYDEGSSGVGMPIYEACPPSVLLKASRSSKSHDDTSSKNVADESACTKINNVVPLQGVPIPSAYVLWNDLSVLEIHPTKDGGHIVVLLGRKDCNIEKPHTSPVTNYSEENEVTEMDVDSDYVESASAENAGEDECAGQNVNFFTEEGGENSKMCVNGDTKHPFIGSLLVYALDLENEDMRLVEEPTNVREFDALECPRHMVMLPLREQDDGGIPVKGNLQGLAALVCADGVLRLLNLSTFKIVSKAAPKKSGSKFISATYCSSLERLCVLTDKGTLHFFVIGDGGAAECAGTSTTPPHLTTPQSGYPLMLGFSSDGSSTSSSNASPSEQLLVNRLPLGLAELQQLRELTLCANLSPCYAATVPPCWSELMQAQKQRRHPQHLQQGDEVQHTRSWRLQTDANSWDEHVFEITLPRSCCIGHVDVKFSLHSPCPNLPHIEVTLLKQNPCGIGCKERPPTAVEETINFNIGQNTGGKANCRLSSRNPVTDDDFHRDHNTEVLCGPISLASCLDLSEHHGIITLSSPRLFKMRGRTLLLHMKAMGDGRDQTKDVGNRNCFNSEKYSSSGKKAKYKSGKGKLDQMLDEYPVQNGSGSSVDRLASAAATKKLEILVGCDWLHEVSITIRRTKQTSITNDKIQRCAMLESNAFAERLLKLACLEGPDRSPVVQGLAIDILVWVASVRLARLRCPSGDSKSGQVEFVRIVERKLVPLIKHCLLLSGRSIAHKCVKLILVCSEGMKSALDSGTVTFDGCVLQALLEWLPSVGSVHSAGTFRWFLLLLCRVMALDVSATTGQTCASLLAQVAEELRARSNPYHMLLRTRFGLYGTPFEAEMFDVDPPASAKFSSTPITYASVVNQDIGGTSSTSSTTSSVASGYGMPELIDLRELLGVSVLGCGTGDGKMPLTKLRGLTLNHYMKGLLEVEPLHFTCYAASDGTKMEKLEPGATPGTSGTVSVPVGNVMESFNFVPTSSGTKKADSDFISFCEDIKKEEMWNSLELKISGESGSIVTLYGGEQKIIPVKCDGEDEIRHTIQFGVAQSSGGGQQCDKDSSSSSSSLTDPAPLICTQTLPYDDAYPPLSQISQTLADGTSHVKQPDSKKGPAEPGGVNLPWQKLLKIPSQHMLVIERMHSGARRFVVLDFGSPVLLTDLLIPACSDLVSLSIDIWCHAEEADGQRLVVASDIGIKSLVLSDLQPPPVCRFLKITTIGRYGMNTTRCKIPVGSFYGHVVVLPGEGDSESCSVQGISDSNMQTQLMLLSALFEDTHCRYSLACAKLQDLLSPLLNAETPNVVNMYHYLQKDKEIDKMYPSADTQKILVAYQECVTFQHQLNLVRNVMRRLELAQGGAAALPDVSPTPRLLKDMCTDKLRVLGEGLLDVLLYLVYEIGPVPRLPVSMYALFDQQLCEQLFNCLCVQEDTRIQLQTCTLLARMCGLQPWWGDFLANTLARLFSSQHTTTFPQDRVFILLTYLGRKSLAAGATCSSVLDGMLALLAELLAPLSASQQAGFLRAEMDLALVGWVLLFLSSCFDMTGGSVSHSEESTDKSKDKEQGGTSRWDFIQGEVAMQRKMATTNRNTASKSYRRKLQKRLMHHKQQLEDLEIAKKAFYASSQVQALTALSNQAANLSNKLEVALKQQEQFYRKTLKQHTSKHFKDILQMRRLDGPLLHGRQARQGERAEESSAEAADREVTICLPQARCLPVARGLVALVLQMDFTCNVDVFLLACKVVARIVASARPRVQLADLMTEQQLLRLLRLAVWSDGSQRAWWGGPWAPHAICCLLQDVLESVRLLPTTPVTPSQEPEEELSTPSAPVPGPSSSVNKSSVNGNGGNLQLPSVLESDDSELEEFLDDILEHGRSLLRKNSSGRSGVVATSHISTALDARLEYGLELGVEVILRKLTALGAHNLPCSVNAGIPSPPEAAIQSAASSSEQSNDAAWQEAGPLTKMETLPMLTRCFDQVFSELHEQTIWTNLELVLQMWLTLNIESIGEGSVTSFDSMSGPMIDLSQPAVSGLIGAFAWNSGISLRAWCLAFQALTMVANTVSPICSDACPDAEGRWSPEDVERMEESERMLARAIVLDRQFLPMLLRFLSGSGVNTGAQLANGCAGPTVCQALHELVMRLQVRCDVITSSSELGNVLKQLLLELVHRLVQPSGALAGRQGPLDAQCKLVEMLLNLSFSNVDCSLALAVIESVGMLVYSYILGAEKVTCPSVLDTRVNASSCFRGLFASVLGDGSKQARPTSWDTLLCCLLKLCNNLVQTPLDVVHVPVQPDHSEIMDVSESVTDANNMFHTDKRKSAKSDQSQKMDVKVPCLADKVLQDERTMRKLLGALAGCSGSTLAMLIGSYAPSEQLALGDLGEPLSVGDAVFQLLTVLSRRATSPGLVLRPLFQFLSSASAGQPQVGTVGVMQLSEPLLWFILRILDSETALEEFDRMGGIKVICENLVKSNQALINGHPSLVSIVLQHLSHPLPTTCLNLKKASTPLQSNEGLINFAPLGTISSSNPTTQPADVLIQASPPHRRARTPAWSYHFYPDEMWVDLTITLPCAVLLKEVQLQPHLTSLATCPSAVAVEVSRDSSSALVPICPPLPTSGLTYIVMNLPQPEVVTSVLLRLYKPHDSSNIGLSQIRLLGTTTFGETLFRTVNMDVPDEEQLTKSSLGWLRLLHHCMGSPAPHLASLVMGSAARVPNLLEACCGLLLIPAPAPSLFTPHLEKVLLRLGLHSRALGLRLILTLLRNGTAAFLQGSIPSSAVVDSVVELLYQLCTTQDESTRDRVNTLLSWLNDTALTAIQMGQGQLSRSVEVWPPSSAYVHCAAAVLWNAFECGVNYDVQQMITLEMFSLMYKWTLTLPVQSALKKAIDTILCSMCYIKPALFLILLQKMGVLVPSVSARQNASDDRKDQEQEEMNAPISDDWKELMFESEHSRLVIQDLQHMDLTESQLMTIALACQSPQCLAQLLQSGLLSALTAALLDFCHRELNRPSEGGCSTSEPQVNQSGMTDTDKAGIRTGNNNSRGLPMLKVDTIATMLNFFAEVCSEGVMRDWLGSPEGSVFWQPLLSLLCQRNSVGDTEQLFRRRYTLSSEVFCALESSTIRFLSRCCSCHPANQQLLSRVLCEVIGQHGSSHQGVSFLHGVSGFTRRLVLQLLLENEKVMVFVHANYPLHRGPQAMSSSSAYHPRYGVGHQRQLILTGTHTTCDDIVKMVAVPGSLSPLLGESKTGEGGSVQGFRNERRKDLWQLGIGLVDQLSMAAGVTAKDKRVKDAKNTATAAPKSPFAKKSRSSGAVDVASPSISVVSSLPLPELCVQHEAVPGGNLPGQLTLSQLLAVMHRQGRSLSSPCIHLEITQKSKSDSSDTKDSSAKADDQLLSCPGLPSPLQVFTQQGGLALLAQHLPLVYPDTMRHFIPDKAIPLDVPDGEWVKVDASDDIYEEIEDSVQVYTNVSAGVCSSILPTPTVPPHSLAAFGLFLRLPGYAEVLLQDKKKAQCLLRLVLGVTDDGEGGDIFLSSVANSLHTLPFQVLRQLFDSSLLTTDDGVLLRRTAIDVGAMHLLLACLSVFTHQSQDINLPGMQHELLIAATKASSLPYEGRGKSDDKSHLYWAKGTGFGTGSTVQSWNVEQALLRQRSEEEHVTVLLQVLSSFVNPGGGVPLHMLFGVDGDAEEEGGSAQPQLPIIFHDLLQQSCLLPAVCSYLRNDSVLDMARHIPLYRAVLQLLRAMALNPHLVSLLLPQTSRSGGDDLSVVCLLTKMKSIVDTYASRLNTNKTKGGSKGRSQNKLQEELESDEGLALLIPDIQETANLVQTATDRLVLEEDTDTATNKDAMFSGGLEFPIRQSLEERYLEVMKRLQFDTYEMIAECPEGGYQFVVSYRFESHVRAAGERSHPSRVKRLAQETVTLSTSLPLSYSSSVFVRCDTDRLDIMKVLITGPAETPYANGCFEFDVYFPPDYPNSPMLINLETTGHHTIRFNPNLYNDGKVCLSVLNTWHGRPEEKWNAQTSSFLQVLVSIQSLILVPEPYFNEPGYERSRGTPSGNQSSREYNSNICQATVKWAMLEQIRNPCPCFKEVIHTHFWMKRQEIVSQVEGWIADMSQCGDKRTGRAISMNAMALTRHFSQLKEELAKLRVPEGLEDLASTAWPPAAGPSQTPDTPAAPPRTPLEADLCSDSEMEKMVSKFCE